MQGADGPVEVGAVSSNIVTGNSMLENVAEEREEGRGEKWIGDLLGDRRVDIQGIVRPAEETGALDGRRSVIGTKLRDHALKDVFCVFLGNSVGEEETVAVYWIESCCVVENRFLQVGRGDIYSKVGGERVAVTL